MNKNLENVLKYPSPDASASTSPAGGEVLKHALRLQCAPDATGFLSDVYKRGTRARKFLADGVQYGRSMIEMLGVLAIIAVLSIGGIAGYSKAMQKFKHDKWLQQIETLIFNIKDAYKNEHQYGKIGDNLLPTLKNLGLVNDIIDENNLDIFGNQVHVDMRTRGTFTRLNLQFDMLPGSDSVQNCHDLLQLIKWHNNDIWAIALCPDKNCDGSWFYQICGKAAPLDFINRVTCMDYDLAKIMKKCQYCHTNSCYAIILFDNNV